MTTMIKNPPSFLHFVFRKNFIYLRYRFLFGLFFGMGSSFMMQAMNHEKMTIQCIEDLDPLVEDLQQQLVKSIVKAKKFLKDFNAFPWKRASHIKYLNRIFIKELCDVMDHTIMPLAELDFATTYKMIEEMGKKEGRYALQLKQLKVLKKEIQLENGDTMAICLRQGLPETFRQYQKGYIPFQALVSSATLLVTSGWIKSGVTQLANQLGYQNTDTFSLTSILEVGSVVFYTLCMIMPYIACHYKSKALFHVPYKEIFQNGILYVEYNKAKMLPFKLSPLWLFMKTFSLYQSMKEPQKPGPLYRYFMINMQERKIWLKHFGKVLRQHHATKELLKNAGYPSDIVNKIVDFIDPIRSGFNYEKESINIWSNKYFTTTKKRGLTQKIRPKHVVGRDEEIRKLMLAFSFFVALLTMLCSLCEAFGIQIKFY